MFLQGAHQTIRRVTGLVLGIGMAVAVPQAPALAVEPAPATAPVEELVLAAQIDSGRLLVATFDGATSAKEVLAGAARRMSRFFDAKATFQGAYGDGKDQAVNASFRARLHGIDVRGVVVASIGPKGGSAAIAYDREDSGLGTLPRLLSTLPSTHVAWHEASTADGSVTLQLPEGWIIASGHEGACDVQGPDAQFLSIGIHLTINTPQIEQMWMWQRAQIGLPARPSGAVVSAFTDPAHAVQTVFPQFYKGLEAGGLAHLTFGEVVESAEAPVPQGLTGKAGLVHFTMDMKVNRETLHCHVVAYVLCSPLPNGQWLLYFSEVGAPEAIFNRDLPMMIQAWKGYKVSGAEIQRRMDDALANMRESNRIMTASAADTRSAMDRCNADFDEVIRGYRTVEDTQTGKWRDVDLGWSQKIVEKLNEHAGYERYKEIPLRDQIFLP